MRREPSTFRISGRIEQIGTRRYVVIVTTEPDDTGGKAGASAR
jgi:hypothetical protein